jgi:hypothetical protein
MHADEARHATSHALRRGRVVRWSQQLDIAFLQHHAAVGGADGPLGSDLRGPPGYVKTEVLENRGRGVQVGHEMRHVVENQLAGRGSLSVCGIHVRANITG